MKVWILVRRSIDEDDFIESVCKDRATATYKLDDMVKNDEDEFGEGWVRGSMTFISRYDGDETIEAICYDVEEL